MRTAISPRFAIRILSNMGRFVGGGGPSVHTPDRAPTAWWLKDCAIPHAGEASHVRRSGLAMSLSIGFNPRRPLISRLELPSDEPLPDRRFGRRRHAVGRRRLRSGLPRPGADGLAGRSGRAPRQPSCRGHPRRGGRYVPQLDRRRPGRCPGPRWTGQLGRRPRLSDALLCGRVSGFQHRHHADL
jgi:hypothetical protein